MGKPKMRNAEGRGNWYRALADWRFRHGKSKKKGAGRLVGPAPRKKELRGRVSCFPMANKRNRLSRVKNSAHTSPFCPGSGGRVPTLAIHQCGVGLVHRHKQDL